MRRLFGALSIAALVTGVTNVSSAQTPREIPNLCTNPTVQSVRNGGWSDPSTWSNGQVPSVNDRVAIAPGMTVTYDRQSDADLACINVFGQLTFRTDISTRLTVGTLSVLPGAGLQIGTSGAPVAANVIAEIVISDRPIDSGVDPEQYGTGLIGFGRVTMHGAVKSPTFIRLAGEVGAGQSSLTLASGVNGWRGGDRLVIPGTNQASFDPTNYAAQWETPTVAAMSDASIELTAGLAQSHRGGRNAAGQLMFLPHVGNLTRNVIIRSQNPTGTRGHVLFTDRAEIDIRYAAFKDLGRTRLTPLDATAFNSAGHPARIGTNQPGRHSLHLEHLFGPASPVPESYQYVLIGNAIDGGSKWGITIHDTHYGLVQDNVVYNAGGAGIVTEDGSETANVIQNNFIVRAWGAGTDRGDGRQRANDWGWEGSGIWLRGPDNVIRNNVVANVNSYAVTYMMLGVGSVRVPSGPGADPRISGRTVNMMTVPLREFSGNEFYAVHRGITTWNLGANCCAEVYDVPVSTLADTRLWHVGVAGYYGYGENRVTFDGWVHYNNPSALTAPSERSTSLSFGDYIARYIVIRQADIQGLRIGVHAPAKAGDTRDVFGSTPGSLTIENSTLRNYWNIYTSTPSGVAGGGSAIAPRLVIVRNVIFSNVPGVSSGDGQAHILRQFTPQGENQNILVSDRVVVESYNGNAGDNFEVFAPSQAANFVIPSTAISSQVAGLTNAQAWSSRGVAIAGSVAPCATTRPGIVGFACAARALPSLPSAPASPAPMSTPVAPPTWAPPPASNSDNTCRVPDPFAGVGGGTCFKGNWYPPGIAPPGARVAASASSGLRGAPGSSTSPPPPTPAPPSSATARCPTPDPFRGMGTCVNGTWVMPKAPAATPSAAPAPGASSTSTCPGADPYIGLFGLIGNCVDGKWVPVRVGTTGGAPTDSDRDGVIDSVDQCAGTPADTPVNTAGCPAGPAPGAASPAPPGPPAVNSTITLNASERLQTMAGWEGAVPAAPQDAEGLTDTQLSRLLDLVAGDLGYSRARLTVRSGAEGPGNAFDIVNDNNDPDLINPAGFRWTNLDAQISRFIVPLRQRLSVRGESLYVNLNYADAGTAGFKHYSNPAEYAEFMLAVFQHMQSKYGFVPDAIEVVLAPNDLKGWSPTAIGQCIVATAAKLRANGFASPEFIGPSTSNMGAAASYIDGIVAVAGAGALLKEIAYHRYGASPAELQAIASRASLLTKRSSMLEYRSDDGTYRRLHEDLTTGRASAWHQGSIAATACGGNAIAAWVGGTATVCPNTRLIQQYTKYVRPGAQRIEATSQNPAFEPVAFVNSNGKYVVVIKSEGSGSFSVNGLPAGTYGVVYTTGTQYNVNLSNVTIQAGQTLATSIPGVGVITIYKQ